MNASFDTSLVRLNTSSNETSASIPKDLAGSEATFQLIVFGFVFVFSMVGNAAMVAVMFKNCRLRSRKDLLLLNMIIAESSVTLTSIPVDFTLILLDKGWVFGSFMCHIIWPLQTAPFGALVLTLTAMSVQHFRGVAQSLNKSASVGNSSCTTIAFIWLFSFMLVTPYGVFLRFVDGQCVETWGTLGSQIYTVSLFVFHYAVPLAVITFCYLSTARRIRRGHLEGNRLISGTRRARMKRSRRHVRTVRMVILFVAVFAVCMLPHQVVWLRYAFGKNVQYPDNLLTFAYIFTFTSSFVNPLLYFTHNPSLRTRFRVLFRGGSRQESRYKNDGLPAKTETLADSTMWHCKKTP